MERYLQIGKVNLRFNLLPHLIISLAFLCISPFLMGVENLDGSGSAKVLEMYVALIGIILMTPVFLPEQDKDTRDLVEAKYTSPVLVLMLRILEAFTCVLILVGVYVFILQYNNCVFPTFYFYWGTVAEAVFLGGMGLCAYCIFDQIAIGYLFPLMYYILAVGAGKKLLKDFYLFSMIYGGYQEKLRLALLGIIFIILGVLYPYINKRVVSKMFRHAVR